MRDDQILKVIQDARDDNAKLADVVTINEQQLRLMVEALITVVTDPWRVAWGLVWPGYLRKAVGREYARRAKAFNENFAKVVVRDRLKI